MLCDATTYYVLRAFPYVGKKEDRASTGLGEFVLLLLEPYQNAGLNVIGGNFLHPSRCHQKASSGKHLQDAQLQSKKKKTR